MYPSRYCTTLLGWISPAHPGCAAPSDLQCLTSLRFQHPSSAARILKSLSLSQIDSPPRANTGAHVKSLSLSRIASPPRVDTSKLLLELTVRFSTMRRPCRVHCASLALTTITMAPNSCSVFSSPSVRFSSTTMNRFLLAIFHRVNLARTHVGLLS